MFVLAMCALLLLAGRGLTDYTRGSTGDSVLDPARINSTVDVSIIDFDYDPAVISIQPGDTVRWTNDAPIIPHTATSGGPFDPNPGSIWDSGFMSSGDTFSFVFDSQGEFDYFCIIHPLNMFGEVIVGGEGMKVAAIPDDISPGALSNLGVDVTVFNFTPANQSGDLWLTVVLPSSQEIDIPASVLSLPSNPISGQVLAQDRIDLPVTISVPPGAPSGHYTIKVKVGAHPSTVIDEDSFEFDVPAIP
jgi:plastocyanin